MGTVLSKQDGYERLPCPKKEEECETLTWLYGPMSAKNCEPLEVPDTNNLVFYSKQEFYPIVIQVNNEDAVLNTVLYLKKDLREDCLCNVKNTIKVFIIDVLDLSPTIKKVGITEKRYMYVSFIPGPASFVRYKVHKRGNMVDRHKMLVNRINEKPITMDSFQIFGDELSCKGH
jgi:hypothetical protein